MLSEIVQRPAATALAGTETRRESGEDRREATPSPNLANRRSLCSTHSGVTCHPSTRQRQRKGFGWGSREVAGLGGRSRASRFPDFVTRAAISTAAHQSAAKGKTPLQPPQPPARSRVPPPGLPRIATNAHRGSRAPTSGTQCLGWTIGIWTCRLPFLRFRVFRCVGWQLRISPALFCTRDCPASESAPGAPSLLPYSAVRPRKKLLRGYLDS
jgi:hypothetical protein